MKKTGPFQEGVGKKKLNAQRGGGLGLERKMMMMNEEKEKMSVDVFGSSGFCMGYGKHKTSRQ